MLVRSLNAQALLALASLGLLAGTADAQSRTDAQIRSDIEFARGLAQKFRFVDLAEELILDLESSRPSKEMAVSLGLAKCDIYAEGARREKDKVKRNELFDKALQSYVDFLDENEFADERQQAERNFIDLSSTYALFLERDLEELIGEEADAARTRMSEVLAAAVERTGDMLDAFGPLDELPTVEKEERWRLMLNMGQLRILQAKQAGDGTFLFAEADEVLEELAVEAGETSGWGLNAYLLVAKSKLAQQEYFDAGAYAEFVVELVVPTDPDVLADQGWNEIPQELKQARWAMVERATPDLIESYALAGDQNSAVNWGLSAYNKWREHGFELTPRGSLALLSMGNALVDAGGWVGGVLTQGNLQWFETEEAMKEAGFTNRRESRRAVDLALSVAQDINTDNKGTILQLYAQSLIKRVRDVPGIQLDPAILYEAAEGTYYEQNYPEAIEAMKGVIAALETEDEATKSEFMPKVLYFMGRAHGRSGRTLEAAMIHRDGIANWAGDVAFDPQNADRFYRAARDLRREASGDQLIEQLFLEAEKFKQDNPAEGENSDIDWAQAERAYGNKDYADARSKYQKVQPSSDSYEKARVKAALCLYKMSDLERAVAEFVEYVDVYTQDPSTTPATGAGQAARTVALAQSTYYIGKVAYDNQDYATAIQRLTKFDESFPTQDNYAVAALYMVTQSHLKSTPPAFDQARAVHGVMVDKFPDDRSTGRAAAQIFSRLSEQHEAQKDTADPADLAALERDMAEMINLSNGLSTTPAYPNLRSETTLWLGLEEWALAEAAARRTLQLYQEWQEDLDKFVAPVLGRALMRQKRVAEAFEVLDAIVPDPGAQQKGRPGAVEDWCKAVTGWIEGEGNQIAEIPGLGGKENFEKAMKHLQSLENLATSRHGKWTSCEWYAARFDLIYGYYKYGQADSALLAAAKRQMDTLKTDLSADLREVEENCGDETLRRRYLWLDGKLR